MERDSDKESFSSSDGENENAIDNRNSKSKPSMLNTRINEDTEMDEIAELPTMVKVEIENTASVLALENSFEDPELLVDIEIDSKKVENVPVRYSCPIEQLGRELASNESVQVVYYLYEKLKKGGSKCDASNAQVLYRLTPKWKWVDVETLFDGSLPVGEAFSDVLPYFKLTFSLARKQEQEEMSDDDCHPLPQDFHITRRLTELLADHSDDELINKNCPLSQALLVRFRTDGSLPMMSQDELSALRQWIKEFESHSPTAASPTKPAKPTKKVCNGVKNDSSSSENISESGDAPLSRYRVTFDPKTEVPLLKQWFEQDACPSKRFIKGYVDELNSMDYRASGRKNLVTEKAVYIWFKNARARASRNADQKNSVDSPSAE